MRYLFVDLLTRQIVEEFPVYGVSLDRKIRGAGNMTASFKLGTGVWNDADLLNATLPGFRALWALRNNVPIWAGPVWSRTYQSQSNSVSLTGQTYESVFAQIEILSRIGLVNYDQVLALKYMIDMMQAQAYSNFGIDTSQMSACGVTQNVTVEPYEHKMFSEPIDDLLKASNSFDYVIDYYLQPGTDNPQIYVRSAYPQLGWNQPGIDLDYPGQITNYYYPESAAKGTVRETLLGQGEGSAMPSAVFVNQDLIGAGSPAWARVDSVKSISNPAMLARVAEEYGRTFALPVVTPTFEIATITEGVDFNEWGNMGVPLNVHVQDARFPDGADLRQRMIGWQYTPPSSEAAESIKVVIEGGDNG
ncbi:MAG TPA: hypothetical protein VM715_21375 [Candidatus Acidoferrum sp.]|nr:hypothetical protein [Candidatus Acidoferrum sp.]